MWVDVPSKVSDERRARVSAQCCFYFCFQADVTTGQDDCILQLSDASSNPNALLQPWFCPNCPLQKLHQACARFSSSDTVKPPTFPQSSRHLIHSASWRDYPQSGVPGRAQLSETVPFMTTGGFPSERRWFKASRAFQRAKLKLHPALYVQPFFVTRPQRTLTPWRSRLNIHPVRWNPSGLWVPGWRPVVAVRETRAFLHVILWASSGTTLNSVDMVECTDWSWGMLVRTLQVSGLLRVFVEL